MQWELYRIIHWDCCPFALSTASSCGSLLTSGMWECLGSGPASNSCFALGWALRLIAEARSVSLAYICKQPNTSHPQQTAPSESKTRLTFSSSAESCALIWEISTSEAAKIPHVNSPDGFLYPACAFKSRLLAWISASVTVMCQNVSSSYPCNTLERNESRAAFFFFLLF